MRTLLANWIMCSDGTMLPSFHVHDFKRHGDTIVDGGLDYLRRGGEYTEMSVYSDDPYEVIRRFVCRGTSGKDGKEPFKWIPLCAMTDEHLEATIKYNEDNGTAEKSLFQKYYKKELEYRKK